MSNRRELLLGSLSSLDGLDQHGGDLEQVAADAVVGDLEDGSGLALGHRDDALGILHTGFVLDGTGDAQSNIDLGVNGLAGLTDLMVGGPARPFTPRSMLLWASPVPSSTKPVCRIPSASSR